MSRSASMSVARLTMSDVAKFTLSRVGSIVLERHSTFGAPAHLRWGVKAWGRARDAKLDGAPLSAPLGATRRVLQPTDDFRSTSRRRASGVSRTSMTCDSRLFEIGHRAVPLTAVGFSDPGGASLVNSLVARRRPLTLPLFLGLPQFAPHLKFHDR